jgi:hypothetical protein
MKFGIHVFIPFLLYQYKRKRRKIVAKLTKTNINKKAKTSLYSYQGRVL